MSRAIQEPRVNTAIVAAIISGAVALAVVTETYWLTKKREQAADWRKLKLDHYREFLSALSGIVVGRATPQAHARYADVLNSLTLVAPGEVIAKLYEYLDETSYKNKERDQQRHDERLSALIRAIRRDVQPGGLGVDEPQSFRLMNVPPDEEGR